MDSPIWNSQYIPNQHTIKSKELRKDMKKVISLVDQKRKAEKQHTKALSDATEKSTETGGEDEDEEMC